MGKGKGRGKGANQPGAVLSRQGASDVVGNPNVHITFNTAFREKSVVETYILAFVLGLFGAHHFYLGRVGYGFAYFFTFGLLGVGYVVDLFRIPCLVNEANRKIREPTAIQEKSTLDAYVLWFPFGLFGFHHFYLRNYGLGILYLFTFGVFGIGWLIDAVRIPYMVDNVNNRIRNGDVTLDKKNNFSGYLFLLSPLGILGGHHYYLNRPGWGVLYTFTLGLIGVGWVYDMFRLPCLVNRANARIIPSLTESTGVIGGDKKHLDDAYILLFPFGFTGLHHFYLRRYCWGVLYFCTFGLLGIGYLIDFCRLPCLVSEYNKTVDENRRIATNFLSTHPPGGPSVIAVTSTTVLPQGGISGSVMQPPPQVWQPGAYTAYPPQYNGTGIYPAMPQGPYQPPSYMESMGNGTGGIPGYQTTIPAPQAPPGYGSIANNSALSPGAPPAVTQTILPPAGPLPKKE